MDNKVYVVEEWDYTDPWGGDTYCGIKIVFNTKDEAVKFVIDEIAKAIKKHRAKPEYTIMEYPIGVISDGIDIEINDPEGGSE